MGDRVRLLHVALSLSLLPHVSSEDLQRDAWGWRGGESKVRNTTDFAHSADTNCKEAVGYLYFEFIVNMGPIHPLSSHFFMSTPDSDKVNDLIFSKCRSVRLPWCIWKAITNTDWCLRPFVSGFVFQSDPLDYKLDWGGNQCAQCKSMGSWIREFILRGTSGIAPGRKSVIIVLAAIARLEAFSTYISRTAMTHSRLTPCVSLSDEERSFLEFPLGRRPFAKMEDIFRNVASSPCSAFSAAKELFSAIREKEASEGSGGWQEVSARTRARVNAVRRSRRAVKAGRAQLRALIRPYWPGPVLSARC